MPIFNKESLEALRQRVDLVEVLSTYLEFKRTGASYKALCPFHDEKTPSFLIHKGDTHYHCFGCGAHGDAIQFLMAHQKMTFLEAVENLAQRFQVHLEKADDSEEKKGPSKALMKEALEAACRFYQFCLLHTDEGHEALQYLYSRGIDIEFINAFRIGLAPKTPKIFRSAMDAKSIRQEILIAAGLLNVGRDDQVRDFFSDRIMFPIHHHTGYIIGFSGRKYKEETFGGKYVNTAETDLFKKSRTLFGFNYSRRRIAKERKAIIVEGQIDALRLIQAGFNITVAGQGTAFGDGHVKELVALGINQVYLAFDSDIAGQEATSKVGQLFQKEGLEVRVVQLPPKSDPDEFMREKGPEAFMQLLNESSDYLTFLIKHMSREMNMDSPAAKNEMIQRIIKLIREWDHPVMVHETLRKLAHLMRLPEDMIGVGQEAIPNVYVKKSASIGTQTIDPDRIIETDLLRWLLLVGQDQTRLVDIVRKNLTEHDFQVTICQKIYKTYKDNYENQRPCDLLTLAIDLDDAEGQLVMSDLLQKKVNKERAEQQILETIQKILDRNWMYKREEIKIKIQSGQCSDDEVNDLAKIFDEIRRNQPQVNVDV
ncbi:MAG: DNA primase [Parachlamydiaceae bacterium]|nr:DNA primase [Parachlamydiaceae bacterium]